MIFSSPATNSCVRNNYRSYRLTRTTTCEWIECSDRELRCTEFIVRAIFGVNEERMTAGNAIRSTASSRMISFVLLRRQHPLVRASRATYASEREVWVTSSLRITEVIALCKSRLRTDYQLSLSLSRRFVSKLIPVTAIAKENVHFSCSLSS